MQQITTKELKEKMDNGENFILDLYATWCGPCSIMLKNLEKVDSLITESKEVNYNIYKFDIDTDKEFVVKELGIRSVPTIKFFKEGKEFQSKTGVISPIEIFNIVKN